MPPVHVDVEADQTVETTVGDYADRQELERLLNRDLAPYEIDGVIYHRYKIDVRYPPGHP